MRILSMNPGHDGAIAFVEDGRLIYSLEGEKDSFGRYGGISASLVLQAMDMAPGQPDVLAIGGWHKALPGYLSQHGAGYFGVDPGVTSEGSFCGKPVTVFTSSHERSHLFMVAAMAPAAPLRECVILVWEGEIGAFYHWQNYGAKITPLPVLAEPGSRYAALFALADRTFWDSGDVPRLQDAGKLMALTAYAADSEPRSEVKEVVEEFMKPGKTFEPFEKISFRDSALYNCGVDSPLLHTAARYLTTRLFETFRSVAESRLPRGLPLLISGGCGLNCEWNRSWRESGLFTDVFVPPCANDSGSAIGTAMDAATYFGEPCRLEWNVYAGAPFVHDGEPDPARWSVQPLHVERLARQLLDGRVAAWVQGRYEIGPRALGHRSLLASPLTAGAKDLLNTIKKREGYRPIAPCCIAEDMGLWFDNPVEDPYMLYFSRVRTDALPAVTHVDGTARVQSVRSSDEPTLYRLLESFRAVSGYGVLCNTSLNFSGHGFINRMSELIGYCETKNISDVIVGDSWYQRSELGSTHT
ncbi:carbamoyltransferase C-terminal domain-containing protein [Frankia sp. Cas4]|uniref:carbamoyltransferase C-terminal domain-containing protein n=1 Tax=Frankia sp. Cas4 TaxID=3073927 RepID=UPI002AD48155|nr:carbamoyltransferase C-terminal domain-containing protein [Frankia sp. Cas4]